jgi:hypothetical protein
VKHCKQCNAVLDDFEEYCSQCGFLEKPPFDSRLLGYWRVRTVDRKDCRMMRMLLAEPGDVVEFTTDSYLVWWGEPDDPLPMHCRTLEENGQAAMNAWTEGLYGLMSLCIYRIHDDILEICVAGDNPPRPTAFRRDDERLWYLVSLERSEAPKKKRRSKKRPLLEPGSFIPTDWLKQ